MELSDELVHKINELAAQYPKKQGALLPILYLVQKEYGYLPENVLREISSLLNIPEVNVFSTTTFYTMFYTTGQGRNIISLCTNMACSLLGCEHIVKTLEDILSIKAGETTQDKRFSLKLVECLGSCGTAPVMMVNEDLHEDLTKEKVKEILERYK